MAAKLTVLFVLEQDRVDDVIYAEAMSTIDEMLKGAKQMNLVPRIRIRHGEPAEEIISECSALRPELLILGALPASPMTAAFRTGVAYRVIAQAPCPHSHSGPEPKQSNARVAAQFLRVQSVS